jgi:hypothetical protein
MKADDAKRAVAETALQVVAAHAAEFIEATRGLTDQVRMERLVEGFKKAIAHVRATEASMQLVVDQAFAEKEPDAAPSSTETDEHYRARLGREIKAGSIHYDRLGTAAGRELDELGSYYDLKRK